MSKPTSRVILRMTLALSLANLAMGFLVPSAWLVAGGAGGLSYVLWRWLRRRQHHPEESKKEEPARPVAEAPPPTRPSRRVASQQPVDPSDTDALVEQMLDQGRFALLLRQQIAANLSEDHFRRALQSLQEMMALVPDGEVVLGALDEALEDGKIDDDEILQVQGRLIQVERFFLDRYPVTNAQYHAFVASGGYEQMALWDERIWTAVLDFTDRSGAPGPAEWNNGTYAKGYEDHPVTGVSWYEASAYARWLGKRLATDAEWVKAGSWPVTLSATKRSQRRFPWGDTMDRTRANLWNSGPEQTVPVNHFADGVSVGGVYQLIGNVWEWTAGEFRGGVYAPDELELPFPMKSVRGGAYDTYFDNQATCHFQSGENPLFRRHNIGFRCAVGVCDLVLARPAAPAVEPAEAETAEEVLA